jgi:chaperonin GroEL
MIAEEFSSDVIEFLAYNHIVHKSITILPIRTPLYGDLRNEVMEDLAVLTGGTFITPQSGLSLKSANLSHLGKAKKVIATSDTCTFVSGFGNKATVYTHVHGLTALMNEATSPADKKGFKERIGKIVGGISLIKVGGRTDSEIKERIDRFEDAINATSVAIDSGILPGRGIALLGASLKLNPDNILDEEMRIGYSIIKSSITQPFKEILTNASIDPESTLTVLEKGLATDPNYGMDLRTGVTGDMIKMGVVDPYLVVRSALENAYSITSLVLNTETLIVDHKENQGTN